MTDYPMIAVALGLVGTPLWFLTLLAYDKYRGFEPPHLLTCPDARTEAAVTLARSSAAMRGRYEVRNCSRWPDCRPCEQTCLAQLR